MTIEQLKGHYKSLEQEAYRLDGALKQVAGLIQFWEQEAAAQPGQSPEPAVPPTHSEPIEP